MIYDIRDPSFEAVILPESRFVTIAGGFTLTEGPVWSVAEDCLYFSDIPASIVYRWSRAAGLSVLRQPSNMTNGNTLDSQGRLLSCEHATSLVSRCDGEGRFFSVLASQYEGQPLNSPNDIICDSRGRIWFTDPPYGRINPRVGIPRPLLQPVNGVYRLETDGGLVRVAEDFEMPNGLCFLPGEQTLLINDTARMHIRSFAVQADGSLSGGEVFATLEGEGEGKPDGMKVDRQGRVYCTGPGGVHVFGPDARLIGIIRLPEICRNFCFGGEGLRTMFFACSTAILQLQVQAEGLPPVAG